MINLELNESASSLKMHPTAVLAKNDPNFSLRDVTGVELFINCVPIKKLPWIVRNTTIEADFQGVDFDSTKPGPELVISARSGSLSGVMIVPLRRSSGPILPKVPFYPAAT